MVTGERRLLWLIDYLKNLKTTFQERTSDDEILKLRAESSPANAS